MAIFLSCQNLSKSFGVRPLFEGLSFGLSEGERSFLVAAPQGQGLLLVGGERAALKVVTSQTEHGLCVTDPAAQLVAVNR